MSQRILLCRPQGGLNDILCQIEKCCQYAEKSKRTVIVDTNHNNTDYFRDKFNRYFSSKQNKLILSTSDYSGDLDAMPVYPTILQNRLKSYKSRFNTENNLFCDLDTGLPTTFDFGQDHPYPLLVHHQAGGGTLSQFALLRLTLSPFIVDELIIRINKIGGPWVGVHIRNTDYTTDYDSLLTQLKQESLKRIFLATDSLQVREHFQKELKNTKIYSFSDRLSVDERPIHNLKNVEFADLFSINRDSILDLLMLSLSSRLVFKKINPNAYRTTNSGYAILSHNLWNCKIILKHLISDKRINFGLT